MPPGNIPGGDLYNDKTPDQTHPDESVKDTADSFTQGLIDPKGKTCKASFTHVCELGRGGFSSVHKMKMKVQDEEECLVALKMPFDDSRDVIEKDVLLSLGYHPNLIVLKFWFVRTNLVHLVLELNVGGDLFEWHHRNKGGSSMPLYTRLFTYQLFRSLAYCHSKNVVHRDIKVIKLPISIRQPIFSSSQPENCLINEKTGRLRLTDFGCASFFINPDDEHINYVGTRDFRAPELLFGATRYNEKVDIWGVGVILTELLRGVSIFYCGAKSSKEQAVTIIKYLGPPTTEDCRDMRIPTMPWPQLSRKKRRSLRDVFSSDRYPEGALDILLHSLVYKPSSRWSAWQMCGGSYFSELYEKELVLPNGYKPKYLFNFSEHELRCMPQSVRNILKNLM